MITYNIINKNIVGSINGKDFSIPYTKDAWEALSKGQAAFQKADSLEKAKKVLEKLEPVVMKDAKAQIEECTPYMTYNPNTRTYHLRDGDKVSVIPLPQNLVDKIKYAVDQELPVDPLIKFTIRALRSPRVTNGVDATYFLHRLCEYAFQTFVSPTLYQKYLDDEGYSMEVAKEMATVYQTPITQEGLLCTKKVVNARFDLQRYKWIKDEEGNAKKVLKDPDIKEIDETTGEETWRDPQFAEDWIFEPAIMGTSGDAFLCGEDSEPGHIIRVGQVMALQSWDQVDCDDTRSCVKGIHTGNQDYIDGWEHAGNTTLNCFVDPADIGAIPYNDVAGVLRVRKIFPESIKDREVDNRNLYHSSTYAAQSDAQWDKDRAEAIERFDGEIEALQKAVEARKAKFGW